MRGFAVAGPATREEPLVVWLVSRANLSEPVNTNAVVWQPDELEDPNNLRRAQGMLAARYVVIAQDESARVGVRFDDWGLSPVGYDDLRGAVTAELARYQDEFRQEAQRRRDSKTSALVEPDWPKLPSPNNYGYVAAADPVAASVLGEANRFVRLWDVWARLERIRRSKDYLTPDAEERILPPAFTEGMKLFEIGG